MLRDYQSDQARGCSRHYIENRLGVLLQTPTGGGKTRTAAFIVQKYAETGRQSLWLVHRQELLLQASMTYSEYGINHRLICPKNVERKIKVAQFKEFGKVFIDDKSPSVISSVQTLVRRFEKLDWLQPTQIIADECHLSLNNTFRKIIGHWPNARLLGLTATPIREDGQSFSRLNNGLYDELVHGPQVYELIEQGYLSDYVMYSPPITLTPKKRIKKKGGDYDTKDLEEEFCNNLVYGDVVNHYQKYSHNLPAIGFCPTVAVAKEFCERFKEAGYKAATLDGTTDETERWQILKDLANGEMHVVMSVDVLIEGTDVPLATTALLLRKTQSLRIYLQSVGRVLRPHPDKEHAIIMDFVGLSQIHGYPDDHREWTLEGKCTRRRNKNEKIEDGEVIRIKTCPKCYRDHDPAPVCPGCGYEYPTTGKRGAKEVDGTLVKIDRKNKKEVDVHMKKERQRRGFEESKCKSVNDFIELGRSRGYQFPEKWGKKRWQLKCMGRS